MAGKLKVRNNIIQKLGSTSWGASADIMKISATALVYSTAEYCAPVWLQSTHASKIDVQLNRTMRIISGAIDPTPVEWLPVLCNIEPPHLRRSQALLKEYEKIMANPQLPAYHDFITPSIQRLTSRKPPAMFADGLKSSNFSKKESWTNEWTSFRNNNSLLLDIMDPNNKLDGFDIPRNLWVKLNRIRTLNGRCADSFYKWGIISSPSCDCGAPKQTIRHIVSECRLRAYQGPLTDFIQLTPNALEWLTNLDIEI